MLFSLNLNISKYFKAEWVKNKDAILQTKLCFPLGNSSVNVTKSAGHKKSLMENFIFRAVSGVVFSSDLNHNWQKYDPYILQLNT